MHEAKSGKEEEIAEEKSAKGTLLMMMQIN